MGGLLSFVGFADFCGKNYYLPSGRDNRMSSQAPRAFNRTIYHDHPEMVFYGTDDGCQDGSFREFADFVAHYKSVAPERRDDIHILERLTEGDYTAETEREKWVRENIRLKQKGCLPRERGSTKRPYEQSWQYAFQNFEMTRHLLSEVPLEIRTEPMESESFSNWIRNQNNLWIYASNITQFHFFDLEVADTSNVVLLQIIHPEQPQLLDLAPLAGGPVKVHFEIPLRAQRIA